MRTVLSAYFLLFVSLWIGSQELELTERHDEVLNDILRLHIQVNVSGMEKGTPWKTELNKLTIPGRTVSITLENKEIKIHGGFTPYHAGDTLMLLTQAQVILLPTEDRGLRYFTSIKALSITLGEKIHFFPLGNQKEIDLPPDSWDIEIELEVVSFQPTPEEKEKMDGLITDKPDSDTKQPADGGVED